MAYDSRQFIARAGKLLAASFGCGQTLLSGSSNASKLFIFKVNYLTWKGNPLESTAEKCGLPGSGVMSFYDWS
jgi:hypothetical protein